MVRMLGFLLVAVGALLVEAALLHWWGRVLLPSLGLGVPGFWTWFWSMVPVTIGALMAGVVKAMSVPTRRSILD